jgi:aryl-alcohol dehydrogenase-like predicted oxidoreductase
MILTRYLCNKQDRRLTLISRLGKSGLKVPKVILGAMSFGDPSSTMGWTLPEADALPVLKRAFDLGINT